jgi:3-hydroxybutyryl-CoA dehydrogenase
MTDTNAASSASPQHAHSSSTQRLAVLGAGTMGAGIAQVAAAAGDTVTLFDVSAPQLQKAVRSISDSLGKFAAKGKITEAAAAEAIARISVSTVVQETVANCTVVIEAVPEKMDLKRQLFAQVDEHCPPEALIASNTSSLSITELATALKQPSRMVGLHFFNPVPLMELLEIVKGVRTDDAIVDRAVSLAQRWGKTAIVVRDFPGFATSRLGVVIGAEAMRMLEQGVASAEDIDRAMELGYRHPMGPLRLTDVVGLDVRLAILEHLHRELGEQFRPPAILRQLVRAGKLGKKSGEGFYRW